MTLTPDGEQTEGTEEAVLRARVAALEEALALLDARVVALEEA